MLQSGKRIAIECKASVAPVLSRGTHTAIDDVDPAHTFVIAPVAESYRIKQGITVVSLSGLFAEIGNIL